MGGKDVNNILHFIDQRKGRWDSLEIIEEMFALQIRWNPAVFFVEDGAIWKSIAPMVYREMQVRDIWINIQARTPVKDKASRGRSLQRRMRASGVRFDKKADWYSDYEGELLRFTGYGEAVLDDQFDSSALLSLGFDDISQVVAEDLYDEDEMEFEQQARQVKYVGRSAVTGY